MDKFDRVDAFVRAVAGTKSEQELAELLAEISGEMGFAHFALTHHIDIRNAPHAAIRIHNYPAQWVQYFDDHKLGVSDPVHRASHMTSVGFAWSRLPTLVSLTARDQEVLALAARSGLGDGFTIPANVPGESNGSCSFATRIGVGLAEDHLPLAQLVGAFAFEAARRVERLRRPGLAPPPRLTDRQRDCVILAARGKSDWEIAHILGISPETVIQYLKRARARYGVASRTLLAVHALFDGTIAFLDVFTR
ncbi:MAG TPA: LuxR family transcriptional regulator [Allosphingosinicella sp.]|jgi:LuxR family quorum-sensing system transcriptional regulator CciR|nr:LuxR family transcriptional regulator [Allosphingosinicella sp.]